MAVVVTYIVMRIMVMTTEVMMIRIVVRTIPRPIERTVPTRIICRIPPAVTQVNGRSPIERVVCVPIHIGIIVRIVVVIYHRRVKSPDSRTISIVIIIVFVIVDIVRSRLFLKSIRQRGLRCCSGVLNCLSVRIGLFLAGRILLDIIRTS